MWVYSILRIIIGGICKWGYMSDTDQAKIIRLSLDEHRRRYDNINNIYDQLRIKALALIAGEVAIITFLFSGWDFFKLIQGGDRLLLFVTGIILLGIAFGFLLWIISTVQWMIPHDYSTAGKWLKDKNYSNYHSFLEYMHDDYLTATKHCENIVNNKCKKFNWSIFLLAGGVIIVMVIKFGGQQT